VTDKKPLSQSEYAESLLSLQIYWSLKGDEIAEEMRKFSLENNLYRLIADSLAMQMDIPFILCMKTNKNGRGQAYCARKDDTWEKILKTLQKPLKKITTKDANTIWDKVIEDLISPYLTEEPPRDPTIAEDDRQLTKFLMESLTATENDDDALKKLSSSSWQLHVELISEILTSLDFRKHVDDTGNYLQLVNLPDEIVSEYYSRFKSQFSEGPVPYSDNQNLIKQIKSIAQNHDKKVIDETYIEVRDTITVKADASKRFFKSVQQHHTSSINVLDQTLTGFLSYPFPPIQ